jgi:hypothetical protein
VFCVRLRKKTATSGLYSINWLVFITEVESVYCAVRVGPYIKRTHFFFKGLIITCNTSVLTPSELHAIFLQSWQDLERVVHAEYYTVLCHWKETYGLYTGLVLLTSIWKVTWQHWKIWKPFLSCRLTSQFWRSFKCLVISMWHWQYTPKKTIVSYPNFVVKGCTN